jgi:hypothetical protein
VFRCLDDTDLSALETALLADVRRAFPQAEALAVCSQGTHRIGIWFTASTSNDEGQRRLAALLQLAILEGQDMIGMFLNASLIRRTAIDNWNSKVPRRLDEDGNPDPDGPVHLTGLDVSFSSPNVVTTRIDGFDESPWPDVSFRVTIRDSLTIQGFALACETSRSLDVDTSLLNVLGSLFSVAGLLSAALGSLLSIPTLGVGAWLWGESAVASGASAPNFGGVGCNLVSAQAFPPTVAIPGGQNLRLLYQHVHVTAGGVFASGLALPEARQPSISIIGPSQLGAHRSAGRVRQQYGLATNDLRGALDIRWSVDSGSEILGSRTDPVVNVQFNVPVPLEPGHWATRRVQAVVEDEDHLQAQAEEVVHIWGLHEHDDLGDDPPVCLSTPWHPSCRNPSLRKLGKAGKGLFSSFVVPASRSSGEARRSKQVRKSLIRRRKRAR